MSNRQFLFHTLRRVVDRGFRMGNYCNELCHIAFVRKWSSGFNISSPR